MFPVKLNAQERTGRSCGYVRNWCCKIIYYCRNLELRNWNSYLGQKLTVVLVTKSVVKGLYLALWNAYANQGQCLYDLGQKQNINIAQVEWEYLVHVHFTVGPRWSRVYLQNIYLIQLICLRNAMPIKCW